MTIIAFNRYWVIRWPWLLINLVAVTLLLGLSFWQWQRATEKSQTLSRIADYQTRGATDIKSLNDMDPGTYDGVQLNFSARWIAPMIWLVDNQMLNGRVGYDVIVAVENNAAGTEKNGADSSALLVNLGWIEAPFQRAYLPEISIPPELHVQGIFRTRTKGVLLGTNIEDKRVWPMRIQQVDVESLNSYVDRPLVNGLAYQLTNSPFSIHYRPVVLPPERHKAYALQWFLLALAVVVIALAASARKSPQEIKS